MIYLLLKSADLVGYKHLMFFIVVCFVTVCTVIQLFVCSCSLNKFCWLHDLDPWPFDLKQVDNDNTNLTYWPTNTIIIIMLVGQYVRLVLDWCDRLTWRLKWVKNSEKLLLTRRLHALRVFFYLLFVFLLLSTVQMSLEALGFLVVRLSLRSDMHVYCTWAEARGTKVCQKV